MVLYNVAFKTYFFNTKTLPAIAIGVQKCQ